MHKLSQNPIGPSPLGSTAVLLLFSIRLLTPAASFAQPPSAPMPVDERVESLLRQMTLDEKIGQITQIGPSPIGPNGPRPEDLIRQGRAGSVLWTIDSAQIRKMQEIAVQESHLKIPLLFGFDVIHGYKNVFPVPLAMASSWDPGMVEGAQAMAAHGASVSGINWTFGPMVDIARDARWAESWKARERIRTSAPPWRGRRCADFKVRIWGPAACSLA